MMDLDNKQKILASFFNNNEPVHIVTWSNSWINGYIEDFDGMQVTVTDRRIGEVRVSIKDISIVSEFTGDVSTLKRRHT